MGESRVRYSLDTLPYYHRVPKEKIANLRFRRHVLLACAESREIREEFWIACARDPLFFLNTFVWIFEPRIPAAVPFITHQYQDETIIEILNAIGLEDLFIDKSRDVGASWMVLVCFAHFFMFVPKSAFLLMSWKEYFVDSKDNPAALMQKLDFMLDIEHMPRWLSPNTDRIKLHFSNLDNASSINGETTTETSGVAGRYLAVLPDEFAKMREKGANLWKGLRDVTLSRIAVTTPEGQQNCAYDLKQSKIRNISIHWTQHPVKARGLYRAEDGQVEIIDKNYRFAPDFQFVTSKEKAIEITGIDAFWEGKERSPWYDNECRRSQTALEISQELEIDYLGSESRWFSPELVERLLKGRDATVREPRWTGRIFYDRDTKKFKKLGKDPRGQLKLWIEADIAGQVPDDRGYVLGVDISQGTGASNSIIAIGDRKTGEIVGEFASAHILAHEFAYFAIALASMFAGNDPSGEAFVVYEGNGPGIPFGRTLWAKGHRNVYFREKAAIADKQATRKQGWWSTRDTKQQLLYDYRMHLEEGQTVAHCKQAIEELAAYVHSTDGDIVNPKSLNLDDPTGARANHADRVIAYACCSLGLHGARGKGDKELVRKIPENCLASRRIQRNRERAAQVRDAEQSFWGRTACVVQ